MHRPFLMALNDSSRLAATHTRKRRRCRAFDPPSPPPSTRSSSRDSDGALAQNAARPGPGGAVGRVGATAALAAKAGSEFGSELARHVTGLEAGIEQLGYQVYM